MARRTIRKPSFELVDWYSGDAAKRSFGRICQAVNEEGEKIGILGTEGRPYLFLEDIDAVDETAEDVTISIEEAKADWSAVTHAAMLYGTRFVINGKKKPRAILYRNGEEMHPALKYRRGQSPQASFIASKLEDLLKEVRKLGRMRLYEKHELLAIASRFEGAAELIERRFREVWRSANGMPAHVPGHTSALPQ